MLRLSFGRRSKSNVGYGVIDIAIRPLSKLNILPQNCHVWPLILAKTGIASASKRDPGSSPGSKFIWTKSISSFPCRGTRGAEKNLVAKSDKYINNFETFIPYPAYRNTDIERKKMLKRILQLSACLMMTLSLNAAQAEVRDSDVIIKSCRTERLENRANCCKPELSDCVTKATGFARDPKRACCIKCMWNFNYSPDQHGEELKAMRACTGQ